MSEISGGELLLKCLYQEGVSTIFAVLDGSHNAVLEKLEDYHMGYVCARHEAAAAHMAEAWARLRGEPGVVFTGIGPGAANMISGVATAYAEGSPLIAISGQRRRNIIDPDRGGGFQILDLADMYRPVTKWSARVRDWKRIPEMVRRAYRVATSGRPGPVYLEIPEDIIRQKDDDAGVQILPPENYRIGRCGMGDATLVARAVEALKGAKRPHLHAGTGVLWAEAWREFLELAEHLGATLTTTLAARGVVPEDHPRYYHMLNREALLAAQSEADVVLAVGTRFGELDGWGQPPIWGAPGEQFLIQIDADPLSLGLNKPVDVAILGDARATLRAILENVKASFPARQPYVDVARYTEMSEAWRAGLKGYLDPANAGVNPAQMVTTVREFFPRHAVCVIDGGNTSLWSVNYLPIYEPRSFLYTAKFGHLGTGLPYAIGAKMANPDRQVVLITGDGAIGFNIQELETARRHQANIIVVASVDLGWGMERSSQLFFGLEPFVETEHVKECRYDLVAQGFGCHGEYVEHIDQLRPALQRAVESNKPALIQVAVDPGSNLAPPGIVDFTSLVYRAEG